MLRERDVAARVRVIGGPSIWSDYTKLLEDLPPENTEYGGPVHAQGDAGRARAERHRVAGKQVRPVPHVRAGGARLGGPGGGTTRSARSRMSTGRSPPRLQPADIAGMASAIEEMLERLRANPSRPDRSRARRPSGDSPATWCAGRSRSRWSGSSTRSRVEVATIRARRGQPRRLAATVRAADSDRRMAPRSRSQRCPCRSSTVDRVRAEIRRSHPGPRITCSSSSSP